jgi:hypothetical protein
MVTQDLKDKQQIDNILRQLDKENSKKKLEIEQKREQMKIKIAKCQNDDAEKQRLLSQLQAFEDSLKDQMKRETENQNAKMLKALEDRRNRRKQRNGALAQKKEDKILNDFKNNAASKIVGAPEQNAKALADKISAGFAEDERVQVSENLLDKRNKQELLALMQSLFDERANALRKFIYEMMKQKQADLQEVKEELDPMREMLKQRRVNNLITEEDYLAQLSKLNSQEHDRRMDIEIEYADKEAEINEQLELTRLQCEAEQKSMLKDRQTQEKMAMFSAMMQKMNQGDNMKQYLQMQLNDAVKEQEQFKKQAMQEKDRKIAQMEKEKEKKMQELADRQDRMFDWEEHMQRD